MQSEPQPLIGKSLGLRLYMHADAVPFASDEHQELITRAKAFCGASDTEFNVVRISAYACQVSFLHYPNFFEDAFPTLWNSIFVDLQRSVQTRRSYSESLNPPILHRKELLLPQDHPARPQFQSLTRDLEVLGVFDSSTPIGFRRQWFELLANAGYIVEGHTLTPIGNLVCDLTTDRALQRSPKEHNSIARHLTALSRDRLSAPVRFLERSGYLNGSFSVFDYGCGRGDDLKHLGEMNVPSNGWDPHYRPSDPLLTADFVNLGFVINVIEDLAERQFALTNAFSLARTAMVVAAMLVSDQRKEGHPYRDGYITTRGTFQKYYEQHELQSFIDGVLDESPIPLGPGVFIVFKSKAAEASFLASRVRSESRSRLRFAMSGAHQPRTNRGTPELRPKQRECLNALWSQMLDFGRAPVESEIPVRSVLTEQFGSLRSALRAIKDEFDLDQIEQSAIQRRDEILVMLAIHHFRRAKRPVVLEGRLKNDIVGLFGTVRAAQQGAMKLIASLSQRECLETATESSLQRGLGSRVESKGLVIHRSLITRLPPELQVTIWAASLLADGLDACDLLRIHEGVEAVSFYQYDGFDNDPLPALRHQCKVNLKRQKATDRFVARAEDVRLIAKSRFLNEESPRFEEADQFDRRLFIIDDFDPTQLHIEWKTLAPRLREALYEIVGHKLVRSKRTPDLDEKCGRFLTYRDLIHCGETQARLRLGNVPENPASYAALRDLATNIIDPVIEYYGAIRLTYGFCSNSLSKQIKTRVAPRLDQHAAHELNAKGDFVCSRKGAAVDFLVEHEDMAEVVKWIGDHLDFDRIYYYGPDRPIHVSFSETPARQITEMFEVGKGRRIPRKFKPQSAPDS